MKKLVVLVAGLFLFGTAIAAEAGNPGRPDGQKPNREAAKEKREAANEKREDAKEAREAKREEAKEKREEATKDNREAKKEEAKEKASDARENRVDKRQDNQEKRINHGINKGYLTPEETAKLNDQQKRIADMEAAFKADGKINGKEFKQLREELNTASRCIFGEKHDAEGKTMPVYRMGKNVFLRDQWAQILQNENLDGKDAKQFAKEFHRMLELKRALANDDIPEARRAKLQQEFNELVNKYFELRNGENK
jgi:hypothetical protein